LYDGTAGDRMIVEEEQDVSEITIVMSGEWAVAFKT
jgi:hypothetical protein